MRENRPPDRHDLLGRLSHPEDDFRKAAATPPIGIDARKTEIDEAVRHAARSVLRRRLGTEDQPHRDHLRLDETVLFEELAGYVRSAGRSAA